MIFNSLNSIIDDILLIFRKNNISESENLSRNQIEQWVHQYRAMLIKQDIDKGRNINPDYVQVMPMYIVKKELVGVPNKYYYISTTELPKCIDLHFGSGLIAVKDMYDNVIQFGTENKANYQKDRKYTYGDCIVYVKNNYLYLVGNEHPEQLQLFCILEDPTVIGASFDWDNYPYPIPVNMIPVIKDFIFSKELNIINKTLTDDTNNSDNDVKIK